MDRDSQDIDWEAASGWAIRKIREVIAGSGYGRVSICVYLRAGRIDYVDRQANETEKPERAEH